MLLRLSLVLFLVVTFSGCLSVDVDAHDLVSGDSAGRCLARVSGEGAGMGISVLSVGSVGSADPASV